MAAVTRLGLYGGPRGLYGDFSTKEEGTPVVQPPEVHPPGMGRVDIRRRIMEEDEMILAVIMAFLQIKDE